MEFIQDDGHHMTTDIINDIVPITGYLLLTPFGNGLVSNHDEIKKIEEFLNSPEGSKWSNG